MQYIHCSELAFIHLAMYFSCHFMGLTHSSRSCIGYQITCYYGYNHSHIDGYLVFLSLFVLSNSILTNIWIFLCIFISICRINWLKCNWYTKYIYNFGMIMPHYWYNERGCTNLPFNHSFWEAGGFYKGLKWVLCETYMFASPSL